MFPHLPQSTWLRTFLIAVLLGIGLGIGLGQQHWIFFGAMLGWLLILQALIDLFAHTWTANPSLLVALGYPLAVLGYSFCAAWAIRLTRSPRHGFTMSALAAVISTLASIPSAIVTMSINQQENFFHMAFYYPPALSMHLFILGNLFISAILGWLLALVWVKLRRSDHSLATL